MYIAWIKLILKICYRRYSPLNIKNLIYFIKNFHNKKDFYEMLNFWESALSHKYFYVKKTENTYIFSNGAITFSTIKNDTYIAKEVLFEEQYKIEKNILQFCGIEKFAFIDAGANRAYTSLYFANNEACTNVYAYELSKRTFELAKRNIQRNSFSNKIKIFNFGLHNKTKTVPLYESESLDCISTLNKDFFDSQQLCNHSSSKITYVNVIKTSEEFKNIAKEITVPFIFKIDIEGSEYEVFDDLIKNYIKFFDLCPIIIGETHCGFERLFKKLEPFGYRIFCLKRYLESHCDEFILIKGHYDDK